MRIWIVFFKSLKQDCNETLARAYSALLHCAPVRGRSVFRESLPHEFFLRAQNGVQSRLSPASRWHEAHLSRRVLGLPSRPARESFSHVMLRPEPDLSVVPK